jgi:hypothetical protein
MNLLRLWIIAALMMAARMVPSYSEETGQDDSANVVKISRVSSSSTPIMKNDSLIYLLDLIFKDFPAKFWSYADSVNHIATIEMFGSEVQAPPIVLPGACPVTKIQIKSRSTKMALSGQVSTITFSIDPGWNVEISQLDSNDIHLRLGKKLEPREISEVLGKKSR